MLVMGLAAITGCSKPAEQTSADLVLENGSIYTVDEARSWAQAVAITDWCVVGNELRVTSQQLQFFAAKLFDPRA